MGRWIGSPQHQFNVGGKQKCQHCGLYFPDTQLKHGCNQEILAEQEEEE